ncbi:MAG: GNAT family protein [Chloroflexi bacterium]|nr:GNAT family protein [Chloroflexota bacterium]
MQPQPPGHLSRLGEIHVQRDGREKQFSVGTGRWGESGEHGYGIFVDNKLAGAIEIRGFESPVRAVSIGYWLSKDVQGRGVITRCVTALIRMAFETYDMNQVIIRVAPENTRSRAIPERLGFTQVGTERQMSMTASGDYLDLVGYSLLRPEWDEQRSRTSS